MNGHLQNLVRTGELRPRLPDRPKIQSLLNSIDSNMEVIKAIPLSEQSATVIFREAYESIRQLGDARWWLLGYEPANHEVSMDVLKEAPIKERFRLNNLSRFRKIRNDANYRGFQASASHAREILEFWDACGREILESVRKAC